MLNTKMGFEKLQNLNQEIMNLKMRGSDVSDLNRYNDMLVIKLN